MDTFPEKIRSFISAIAHGNKMSLLAILLLIAAVPLTVLVAQQQQDIRQHAASAPDPVTNVLATTQGCTNDMKSPIKITWTNPTNAQWHKIERTTDNTNWALVGYTDGTKPLVAEYTDTTPEGGKFYAYRVFVAATGFNVLSNPSVQTNATWPVAAVCTPTSVVASPVTNVQSTALTCTTDGKSPIKITWTNPTNAQWHKIERTTDNTNWALVGYTDGTKPLVAEYTDTTPEGGKFYAYRVINAQGGIGSLPSSPSVQTNATWPVAAVCTDGLVSYWAMDETGGRTVVDSKNINNGTVNGSGVTVNNSGKLSNAKSFSGAAGNYISVGNNANLNPGNISISAWVNPAIASQTIGAPVVAKGTGSGGEAYSMDFGAGNLTPRFYFWKNQTLYLVSATTQLPLNAWSHLAGTFDGSTLKLYINGVLNASISTNTTLASNTHDVTIGCRQKASSDYDMCFNGSIDEVGIWNRSLTTDEIQKLAQGSPPPPPPGGITNYIIDLNLPGIGLGGNLNPLHPTRSVVLSIFNQNNEKIASVSAPSVFAASPSGKFVVSPASPMLIPNTVANGSYILKVSTSQFLTKQLPGVYTIQAGTNVILPTTTLITGDVNNDNKLDILDYNIIASCFGDKGNAKVSCAGPTINKTAADLNDDGAIDGIDYNLFIRSLSTKEGD